MKPFYYKLLLLLSCAVNLFFTTSCNNRKKDLPEIDFIKIYKSKIKVYDTNMIFFKEWGNICIKKELDFDENLIKDIKVYKDLMYILTVSNVIKCYYSKTGLLKNEYTLADSIIDFDLDTLNMNLSILTSASLSLFNDKTLLIRQINLKKTNSFSRCIFVDKKILLISNSLPQCYYLLLDSICDYNNMKFDLYESNSSNQIIKPLFFVGNDHHSILYKNILNDTIYRFDKDRFIPFIKCSIGKFKIMLKQNEKYKDNARFRVLNMWHINNYWFVSYTYRMNYNKKKIDWNGLAILDNDFKIIESDFDSYLIGKSIYFDGKQILYINKENNTFYQIYKQTKSKMYINDSDHSLSDSISINYFKVK